MNGIIENTIKKFEELNSKSKDIIAVIGPCIGKNNYEVKEDFIIKFNEKNEKNKKFFYKKDDKQFTFDLRGFINQEIFNLNIKNIENIEMDTFSEDKLFFSYRRSRISNEKDYGRCISVILMT